MNYTLRTLALSVLVALMACSLSVGAVTTEEKQGTGDYTIQVHNGTTTGVDITGDWFHAYQIFTTNDVTSYAVTENFKGFFAGNTMVAGDGSGDVFDFQSQLDAMVDPTLSDTKRTIAEDEYNQLAGLYFSTYQSNMYTLAEQIRTYLDMNGLYAGVENGISCSAHSQAILNKDGTQSASLTGLDAGYYFVMDQESTVAGLGIAASGAFVPIVDGQVETTVIVEVKDSVPTVTKKIYHDDLNSWDVVGDHAIGDTVEFLITSTLPSNIEDYTTYTYTLSDTMSAGITYNSDVIVYTDAARTTPVDSAYITIDNAPAGGETFTISVDVVGLLANGETVPTLYTYYTGVVNAEATVATGHDTNTVTLEYSNNPNDASQTGTSSATVFHYTFALTIHKVDQNLAGLAGARFGIFYEDGTAIPLREVSVDLTTGVVSYCYDSTVTPVADGGYITTRAVTLNDGSVVTGQFQIFGLNDGITYLLREVQAPTDYNAIADISFILTPSYTSTGTGLTGLTDGSSSINTADYVSSATIMNRRTVFLPETGGVGTVVFQVGGVALITGAAALAYISLRKKQK